MQGCLFEWNEMSAPKKYIEKQEEYPYIIYIATEKGNCTGIIYESKTLESAQMICSHPKSSGIYIGVQWAYFYTKKSNIEQYSNDTYNNFIAGAKNMID